MNSLLYLTERSGLPTSIDELLSDLSNSGSNPMKTIQSNQILLVARWRKKRVVNTHLRESWDRLARGRKNPLITTLEVRYLFLRFFPSTRKAPPFSAEMLLF